MAIRFQPCPGRRLTETDVAAQFCVSRTPVREALNRLASEGLLLIDGRGRFAIRSLDAKECFDLWELRLSLELTSIRWAIERASDVDLDSLVEMARRFANGEDCSVERVVELDEHFHEQVAGLSGNTQLVEAIRSINARIRYVRLIDLEEKPRSRSLGDHVALAQALKTRNVLETNNILREHITRKMPDIVDVVRRAIARIHVEQFDQNLQFKSRGTVSDAHEL